MTFPFPLGAARTSRRMLTLGAGIILGMVFLLLILFKIFPGNLRGALFQRDPAVTSPATGIHVSRGYQARPNERGSFLVEAGETLVNFEGLSVTVITDPARAKLLQVRRTAVTQNFDISTNFISPGVLRIALVGAPRQVSRGQSLFEIEVQLADHTTNPAGSRIDIRFLSLAVLAEGNRLLTLAHDGLITITGNQDALTLPFTPFIADIEPAILPLVQHRGLLIRGQALPASARVLLGSRSIPVLSASPTQIIATVPEDMTQGISTVSVESILADEKAVIFDAPGPSGSVDILEDLLFFTPNPVLFNADNQNPAVTLWVPVHNPLGSTDPVAGSVDLSRIGGDPNVIFSGLGTPAVGPGGVTVNWFRIPQNGALTLPSILDTNVDYPVTVRVENRTGTRDTATELLSLRSQIPQGTAPFFGKIETVPAAPVPGDDISFFTDVSDPDGVQSVEIVSARLTPIRGGIQSLSPVLSLPSGGVPMTTMTFSTDFTIPPSLPPGTYQIDFTARDKNGNQSTMLFPLIVSAPGAVAMGSPPQFSGHLEARPLTARPGGDVDFFAGVLDPDGSNTLDLVSIDLISIGGGVEEMTPALNAPASGTLPLTFTTTFTVPTNVAAGMYAIPVRAVDIHGRSASATIPLTIDTSVGGGAGAAPQFSGRLEASPMTASVGTKIVFFAGVQDRDGTDTVSQVTIDLVSIGGSILELKPAVSAVSGSPQSIPYTGEFTLPSTARPGIYPLEVRAIDKDGNQAKAQIAFTVSSLSQQGSIPTILQLFSTPASVPADNKAEVSFTVEVEDGDGVADIETVSINLTPLRLGLEFLKLQGDTRGGRKGIFTSGKFKVPTTVSNGAYDLTVEAEDKQGNVTRKPLRLTVGRALGGGVPAFREVRFVPSTVRPEEKTKLFAEVQDENGTDTVTVVADFTDLRGSVETLDSLVKFPTGTLATQNTFASDEVSIPKDLPLGVYDIPLTTLDSAGNLVTGSARLRVERSGAEKGQAPNIDPTKAFQSPRVFINDDKTKGEMHVLVNDPDDDVLTVIANLGSLGTADSASPRDGVGDIALLCDESRALVCMQPSVPNGLTGRWFVLRDMVIPGTTLPSSEPYHMEFTAIDAVGHTNTVMLPVLIGGSETSDALRDAPSILAVVPVDEDELEVMLSSPVQTALIDRSGSQFQIQQTLNALTSLRVQRVSFDTTGRLLYMQTDPLTPGETYTLSVIPPKETSVRGLLDVYGNRFTKDRGGSLAFTAFRRTNEAPKIQQVKAVDETHVDIQFSSPVLPSSVHPDLLPSHVLIRSLLTGEQTFVNDGELREQARVLRLDIDPLRKGERYSIRLSGVLAPGLMELPASESEQTFIALFAGEDEAGVVVPTADLNGDGRVDFADFTLFSAVYDTTYDLNDMPALTQKEEKESGNAKKSSTRNAAPEEPAYGGNLPTLQF